jgi:hypothetical protein
MGQGFTTLIVRFESLGKRGRKRGKGGCQITTSGNDGSICARRNRRVHVCVLYIPTNAGISKNASHDACAHHSSLTSDFDMDSDISGVSVSSRTCIAIILPRPRRRVSFGVVPIAADSLDRRGRPSSFGVSFACANGRPCVATSRGWTSSCRRRAPLLSSSV